MRALLTLSIAGLLLSGCGPTGEPEPRPTLANEGRAEAAVPAALGDARCEGLPLRLRVLAATQVSQTLQVEFEVVRGEDGGQPADPAALQRAMAGLAGLSLVTADGRRRLFPLGDGAGKAAEAPAAGGATRFRLSFVSDPRIAGRVTLVVPGCATIAGVPVS